MCVYIYRNIIHKMNNQTHPKCRFTVKEAAEEDVRLGDLAMAERLKSMQAHTTLSLYTLSYTLLLCCSHHYYHTHYYDHHLIIFLVWTCGGGVLRWPSV